MKRYRSDLQVALSADEAPLTPSGAAGHLAAASWEEAAAPVHAEVASQSGGPAAGEGPRMRGD
ncbi:hypothetical protein EYF80_052255 [Liparis tanakae]|uniref:Uncharacterized protein n=1 Tax=Liparis tanakae TaxID=230148 RepID=A0A4Z2FB21_9TELE|nr:hypothetical protein EYF80_052255 [Liparis tanakae]